jgi:hypothetical protein
LVENETRLTKSSKSTDEIAFLEINSLTSPPKAKMTMTIEITIRITTGVNKLSDMMWINEVNVSVP